MKSIILSRVSSEDQIKGKSLDAQKRECGKYVKENRLELLKLFEFQESATIDERDELNKCLEFIHKQKETIALVVHCVDRLQRGFKESTILEKMIMNKNLEVHFIKESLVVREDNFLEVSLQWDMYILGAKIYVNSLKKHVRKGMKESRAQGIVYKFPEGYFRQNGQVDTTDSSELISEAFNLFRTGNYNQAELCDYLNKKGFKTNKGKKLTRQTLNKTLNNSFYYGLAKSKYGNYRHIYKPLTTKIIFDKCQAILNQNQNSGKKQKRGFKPYPFRNLLTCSKCNRTINPYTAKQTYNYHRCINKDCIYYQQVIKEEVLLKQAENILTNLVFPSEAVEFIVEKLKNDFNNESLYQKQQRIKLNNEIEKFEDRRSRLTDLFVDGSITKDDYTKKQQEYESKIYELNLELSHETRESTDLHLTVSSLFNLINRLPEVFKSSNSHEKNQILKYLISNSLQTGQKAEFNLKKPFLFLYKNADKQHWFGDRDSNSG